MFEEVYGVMVEVEQYQEKVAELHRQWEEMDESERDYYDDYEEYEEMELHAWVYGEEE